MLELIKTVPTPIAIAIVCLAIGVGGVFAADNRYVLKDAFQRNYELSLMEAIRDVREDLKEAKSDEAKALLRADMDQLLDEFCRGSNANHRYCKGNSSE